jgi:VanZ family protein
MHLKLPAFIFKYHLLSLFTGLAILLLCIIKLPPSESGIQIPYFDKMVHFTMYLALSGTYLLESTQHSDKSFFRICLMAIFLAAIFGGAIEFIQLYLTSYRSGEWMDWFSDLAGAVTGCVVGVFFHLAFRSHGR